MSDVVVVDYGAGNTRSVRAALARLGRTSVVSNDPDHIVSATHVILPGVGSARSAMEHLRASGADNALRERFARGSSILGICLGLQLAMDETEEDGGVTTLGLVEGRVRRLREGRVPRLGWSNVEPDGSAYYFAHSFAAESPYATATAEGVTAVVEAGGFVGVQFHPEKSGPDGAAFLDQCLSRA